MSRSNKHLRFGLLALLGLTAWLAGCGKTPEGPGNESAESAHIRKVPGLVSQYQLATKKQPASIEEVRDWAVKEGKASDEDFSSTRDKELYGIANSPMGIVVYEKTGSKGKCYIMRMGGISEVSSDEAKRIAEENPLREGRGRVKKTS